jgi:hypothetical protein
VLNAQSIVREYLIPMTRRKTMTKEEKLKNDYNNNLHIQIGYQISFDKITEVLDDIKNRINHLEKANDEIIDKLLKIKNNKE